MAFVQIPVRNDSPAYEFQITLEGGVYFLGFRFNTRADRWFMDIKSEVQEPILMGIPVLTGLPLVFPYTRENKPQGTFYAIDLTGAGRNADRDSFGVDVLLQYDESVA